MAATAATARLDALDALEDRVTELMLTSASAIEALAANELDADGFIEKAERYLQHIEDLERELHAQTRSVAAMATATPFAVNAYTDEKGLALTAAEVGLVRDMVGAGLSLANGTAPLPSAAPAQEHESA